MVFVISQMAPLSTKNPRRVYGIGDQALKYASTTLELGLEFRRVNGPSFGAIKSFAIQQCAGDIADASHSPNGERSRRCVSMAWKGCTLLWEATRQSCSILSPTASELTVLIHASQVGECVGPLFEELVGEDVIISLLGDNSASLASYERGTSRKRYWHNCLQQRRARHYLVVEWPVLLLAALREQCVKLLRFSW